MDKIWIYPEEDMPPQRDGGRGLSIPVLVRMWGEEYFAGFYDYCVREWYLYDYHGEGEDEWVNTIECWCNVWGGLN